MFIICKHTELKSLVISLPLQQIRDVGAEICMLSLSILDIVIFIILNARKLKLFRGHLFSNAVKIMLFISDTRYNVPVRLCRIAGSIHLFKITGK